MGPLHNAQLVKFQDKFSYFVPKRQTTGNIIHAGGFNLLRSLLIKWIKYSLFITSRLTVG